VHRRPRSGSISPSPCEGSFKVGKKPKKRKKKLTGTVDRLIKSPDPRLPEKAQINIHEADDLYKEIRIENKLKDEKGKDVRLKEGADVDVTVEAEPEATTEVPQANKSTTPP
jgi:uncharacterized protein YfaS (alpha-2-macroglobulin family)